MVDDVVVVVVDGVMVVVDDVFFIAGIVFRLLNWWWAANNGFGGCFDESGEWLEAVRDGSVDCRRLLYSENLVGEMWLIEVALGVVSIEVVVWVWLATPRWRSCCL